MSTDDCRRIEEAVAAGEPLGADDAAHAASCESCRAVAATAKGVRELWPDRSAELARGFRARFRAGGHARIEKRARRRRAGLIAGAVATAGALWLALPRVDREPATPRVSAVAPAATPPSAPPEAPLAPPSTAELDALLAPAARWELVEEPLAPYQQLADAVPPGGER